MEMQFNINKIHGDLLIDLPKSEINILEKSSINLSNYFDISIKNDNKEIKASITMESLNNYNFSWSYLENPLDESSDQVYRNSSIDSFSKEIKEIFEKERFSTDYLSELNK